MTAAGIGVGPAFGVNAVIYTAITLTPLLGGSWRLMERDAVAGR